MLALFLDEIQEFLRGMYRQLMIDIRDMCLGGVSRDYELRLYIIGISSLCDKHEDLGLSRRQPVLLSDLPAGILPRRLQSSLSFDVGIFDDRGLGRKARKAQDHRRLLLYGLAVLIGRDRRIALVQRKLDHLKELKKGLLQQMFV